MAYQLSEHGLLETLRRLAGVNDRPVGLQENGLIASLHDLSNVPKDGLLFSEENKIADNDVKTLIEGISAIRISTRIPNKELSDIMMVAAKGMVRLSNMEYIMIKGHEHNTLYFTGKDRKKDLKEYLPKP